MGIFDSLIGSGQEGVPLDLEVIWKKKMKGIPLTPEEQAYDSYTSGAAIPSNELEYLTGMLGAGVLSGLSRGAASGVRGMAGGALRGMARHGEGVAVGGLTNEASKRIRGQ